MDTLYYYPGACSLSVHAVLEETRHPYEARKIDIHGGENETPEYLAINPLGLVPALVTADGILTEAPAILLHLADAHPEAKLLPPAGTLARTRAHEWLLLGATHPHPAFSRVMRAERFTSDPQSIDAVRARGRDDFWAALRHVDARLAGRTFARRHLFDLRPVPDDLPPLGTVHRHADGRAQRLLAARDARHGAARGREGDRGRAAAARKGGLTPRPLAHRPGAAHGTPYRRPRAAPAFLSIEKDGAVTIPLVDGPSTRGTTLAPDPARKGGIEMASRIILTAAAALALVAPSAGFANGRAERDAGTPLVLAQAMTGGAGSNSPAGAGSGPNTEAAPGPNEDHAEDPKRTSKDFGGSNPLAGDEQDDRRPGTDPSDAPGGGKMPKSGDHDHR